MYRFNYLDTKFLAVNGELQNTINGGTAMLQNEVIEENNKMVIRAKLPTVENSFLTVEIIQNELVISANLHTLSKFGVVFNAPFGACSFPLPIGVEISDIEAFDKGEFLEINVAMNGKGKIWKRRNIDINFDEEF